MTKPTAPTLTELTYQTDAFTVHTDLTALRVTVTVHKATLTAGEARMVNLQRRAAEWVIRETREWRSGKRENVRHVLLEGVE